MYKNIFFVLIMSVAGSVYADENPAVSAIRKEFPQNEELFKALIEFIDGKADRLKQLIASGVDLNQIYEHIRYDQTKWYYTALGLAVMNKNKELVGLLLEAGADVNQKFPARNGYMATAQEHLEKYKEKTAQEVNDMIAYLKSKSGK